MSATQLVAQAEAAERGKRGDGDGSAAASPAARLLAEQTQGATIVKARSRHAPTQVVFRDGYEDWRSGMNLAVPHMAGLRAEDNSAGSRNAADAAADATAGTPHGLLPGRRAPPPPKLPTEHPPHPALDPYSTLIIDEGWRALRHGNARSTTPRTPSRRRRGSWPGTHTCGRRRPSVRPRPPPRPPSARQKRPRERGGPRRWRARRRRKRG